MLSSETLSLKYRPASFDDVVGQKATKLILAKMVQLKKVPTGLLFAGCFGTGKTSIARLLSAALNCSGSSEKMPPCGNCVHCKMIFNGMSTDVTEVDAASHGSVAHIRELTESLKYASSGNYRILVIDEAHSMSREAYYALLKTLEEPPQNTVFILCTTEPHRILDTIKSRLMLFQFKKISHNDILQRLSYINEQESLNVQNDLLALLAERAKGGLRDAIMEFDQISRIGITSLSQFRKFTGEVDYSFSLIEAMYSGDICKVFEIVDEQLYTHGDSSLIISTIVTTLRQTLVAGSVPQGGPESAPGGSSTAAAQLAGRMPSEALYRALRLCWELEVKLTIKDHRCALDLLCVMLTETLSGKKNLAREVKKLEEKKLTLEQMRMI